MNTLMTRKLREIIPVRDIARRVNKLDLKRLSDDLDAQGCTVIEKLITPEECDALAGLYPKDEIFRSRIAMARPGFGRREYKYFSYPLPSIISQLRTFIYFRLAPIANRWSKAMDIKMHYPKQHADYLERCHEAGQRDSAAIAIRAWRL
ncbi:hypothetical protein SAMN05216387_10711 [Nitrosovibrio tenuis]|uniref:Uncharacterized protein n=1 Tax=Nitrosovibrio tenuis TaxID=1233 RepID=A0A1H7NHH0_9PROT|nr:2OG-Fe(II) oxygenase [Nitrosovibrio tenuis]SEL22781.1 hypothetical protein SAMN05216387_10711 [Nitrosovibrio tenuis]